MGWIPMQIRRKWCILQYWNRLVKLDNSRITKKIFNEEYNNNGKWCKYIKNVLIELHYENEYNNKQVIDLTKCCDVLFEQYKNEWRENIMTKPKLRTYVKIKESYNVENYIILNMSRQERSILAQLRCGVLPLHIETGRFCNIPREKRTCNMCNDNHVEDELHFILQCPKYNDVRNFSIYIA